MIQLTANLPDLSVTIVTSITAFTASNLDDILVLTLFFGQVNRTLRPKHIWLGQYLGFTVLILASLPGFFGGFLVSRSWLGLLGLLPIAIGFSQFFQQEESEFQTVNPGILEHQSKGFLAPQIYQVAAVTIANGGDNIGIYVPLFATRTLLHLVVTLAVFFILIAVWCLTAHLFSRHPAIAQLITRYGDRIVPFVLIGLGIYILLDSKTHELLSIP